MIRIKRAYESPSGEDGSRFLVDALWPRGVKKDALHIEAWVREVAPSKELRQWFAHEPSKWAEFKRRYSAELKRKPAAWRPLLDAARKGDVALVFGARDTEHNNAAVLKDFLKQRLA